MFRLQAKWTLVQPTIQKNLLNGHYSTFQSKVSTTISSTTPGSHSRISFTMFTAYDCFRRLSLYIVVLQLAHCHAERIPDEVPVNRVGEIEQSIGFYQAIELVENSLLYRKQSQYQSIEVHQTKHFGKLLLLDGVIQLTERDADSYNEMMAHVPMFQHPNPKRVLVIGGGDGYVLKEVLKHPTVEVVDHVDLDEEVINTCQVHFPQWGDCWQDPRASLHIKDGAQFVRDTPDNYYDVIIQDSSDPWIVEDDGSMTPLPSGVLYEQDHICQLQRILSPNGILNLQGESFNVPSNIDGIASWRKTMEDCGFSRSRYGSIMTVSYTTGHIGMLLGEKNPSVSSKEDAIMARYKHMVNSGGRTTYYHPGLQRGAFDLPLWAHDAIYGEEDTSDLLCQIATTSTEMLMRKLK